MRLEQGEGIRLGTEDIVRGWALQLRRMGEEADMIPFYRPFPLPSDTNNRFRAQVLKILWTREYTKGTLSDELADKIAERTGYEFAIPVVSGTAAIMLLARWYKHRLRDYGRGHRPADLPRGFRGHQAGLRRDPLSR